MLSSYNEVTLHLLKTSQAIGDSGDNDAAGTYDAGEIPHSREEHIFLNKVVIY